MCDDIAWTHSTCSHLVSTATETTAISSSCVSQDVFSEGPHAYLENTGTLKEAERRWRVPVRLRWTTIAFPLLLSFLNSNQWVWRLPLRLVATKIKYDEVCRSVHFANASKGSICDSFFCKKQKNVTDFQFEILHRIKKSFWWHFRFTVYTQS